MKYASAILLIMVLTILSSCDAGNQKFFAIRDFRESLQPYLTEVVSKGMVGYDTITRYIQSHTTDKELKQLSRSEHPVLRAIAFREMLRRPSFNHFDLMMNNLDDTAIVTTDAGEFGVWYLKVSDDMLREGKWKDTIAKSKTIKEIILKHNYLGEAYTKLLTIETNELYYPSIKAMAQRERDNGIDDIGFSKIEYALYALAKFKKNEDVPIIKELLLSNIWQISYLSFKLMQEYRSETYLDVYEKFYRHNFYRQLYSGQNSSNVENFISSVATYKNERSAKLLDAMLNKKPFLSCTADVNSLNWELVEAIWNNPCAAYAKLRRQVESQKKKHGKEREGPPVDSEILFRDTSAEPVSWW